MKADDNIINAIVEFLPGLREILLYGLKNNLIKKFFFEIKNKFKVILKLNFLTKNNKNIFELLIAIVVFFFLIFLSKENVKIEDYFALIIFYIALFTRIMPILTQLLSIKQKK